MAVYKELSSNDFQFREFQVYKQQTFTQANNNDVRVYDAIEVTASAFYPWGNVVAEPTGNWVDAIASGGLYKRTVYDNVNHLYYNLSHELEFNTSSDGYVDYYNVWQNFGPNNPEWTHKPHHGKGPRGKPYGLPWKVSVVSIPNRFIGNGMRQESIQLEDVTLGFTLNDDGFGNLYDFRNSASFAADKATYTVGNVFYDQGVCVIYDTGSYFTSLYDSGSYNNFGTESNSYIVTMQGTSVIYEYEAYCTIKAGEANIPLNPTARVTKSLDEPTLLGFVTSSDFTPYVTTIGLYDDYGNLLVVGKLNQPVRNDDDLDMTIVVRYDL